MRGGEPIKSEARLDSVVFQLTPTRTRCVLVINANGKTEKIASGLSNPFLAHLKTAQDQIAKGGYSITLQPGPGAETEWFTKGTVERFVRFVSTPEVLERVNTIESEILQIEEAIVIQGNESLGLETAEAHQSRPMEELGGSKHLDTDTEKAIILYKPGALSTESNGSTVKMEHSKVQLLRVLETRKTVLQKEQGMAFARALAAGFDRDQLEQLMAFAECFGASRLLTACTKFMELWRAKHETGQWVEIEAVEAMSMRSEFSAVNASGIMFSGANGDFTLNNNGKASSDTVAELSSQHLSPETIRDKRLPGDAQYPIPPHEYFQGQFQHPMFPQWPIQSPQGAPVFQPYPMQSMPYYQNYPGGGPYFQPPYAPTEDPRYASQRRRKTKNHSTDDKDSNEESETSETEDGADRNTSGLGKDVLQSLGIHKKGRSGKNKGGTVVIRNINYIASKRHSKSGSESESASSLENEETGEGLHSAGPERKHKKSSRSSKDKGAQLKSVENANTYDEPAHEQEGDSGNWQVFQSFLLRNEDDNGVVPADEGLFFGEKQPPLRRRQSNTGEDPVIPAEQNSGDISGQRFIEFDTVNDRSIRKNRQGAPDIPIYSNEGRGLRGGSSDVKLQDMEIGAGGYRSRTSDDFMLHGQEQHSHFKGYLDPLTENAYRSSNFDKNPQPNVIDDSFIVPFRSGTPEQAGTDNRATIDINSEFPSGQRREDNLSKIRNHVSYEPDDLTMMPERDLDMKSLGYDPAIDYDREAHVHHSILIGNNTTDNTSLGIKEEPKKSDREKKTKNLQDSLERRKLDALKKGRTSKMNPQAEARARAEKLRAFKADMQKLKQEKEEEQRQRLEALKREREKRIAARGGLSAVSTPLQNRTRLPSKVSPVSLMGSKFSDSEPGSSSPLQKNLVKTSAQPTDSQKATRTSRLNGTHSAGNGLSRSVSSLAEMEKEHTPESKSITVVRRLSEPRTSSLHRASSLKSAGSVQISKQSSDLKSNKTHHVSSMKSEGRDHMIKKVSNEIQVKKNSAIMNLDKSKSATLPELKIQSPTAPVTSQSKITKEAQLTNASKSSPKIGGDKSKKTTEHSDGDDNLVIEKNVVNLVEEKYSSVTTTEGKSRKIDTSSISNKEEKTEAVAAYSAIWAPPSVIGSDFAKDMHKSLLVKQPSDKVGKDPEKLCTSVHIDKAYEAPHARASSSEDSSISNLVCAEAPLVTGSQLDESSANIVTHKSNLPSSSMEHSPETLEKRRGKESSKGFKRLLKFGRKSQASCSDECHTEADRSSIGDTIVSSTEDMCIFQSPLQRTLFLKMISTLGEPRKVLVPSLFSHHSAAKCIEEKKNSIIYHEVELLRI